MTDSSKPVPSPEPSFILRGHNAIVHSLAFLSPATGLLVAADERGLVRAWDLESRRPSLDFFAGPAPVLTVLAVSDDELFTQDKAGTLKLWNVEKEGSEIAAKPRGVEHKADIHSFCKSVLLRSFDCRGQAAPIAFSHGSDAVGVWDTRSNVVEALMSPQSGPTDSRRTGACMSLAAVNALHLCGAYEDGAVRVWDIRKQWPMCVQALHSEPIFGLSVMPSSKPGGAACISGGADGTVAISRLAGLAGDKDEQPACSITEKGRMALQGQGKKGVSALSVRGDGRVAAAGCWDGRVRLYGVKKPRQVAALQCHTAGVQAVEFSHEGRWLASASEDSRIALWSVFQDPPEREP